jgi:hypothetical protein
MKLGMLAAALAFGGLVFSGCSSSDRTAPGISAGALTPAGVLRSQGDLQRYLAATARSGSPLDALSSGARERFLSSITFNEKGITGFHYDDLQAELTASQIVDVLHLFGVEKDVAIIPNVRVESAADRRVIRSLVDPVEPVDGTDYKGYHCAMRATCTPSTNDICTSNC